MTLLANIYSTRNVGVYRTSQHASVWLPMDFDRKWRGVTRCLIGCHGAGGYESSVWGSTGASPNIRAMYERLAAEGVPVIHADLGDPSSASALTDGAWTLGNAEVVTAIGAARTYMNNTWGVKSDKVMLFGQSMGGLSALNWTRDNLSSVSALAGVVPLVDLNDVRDNDRGGGPGTQLANIIAKTASKSSGTELQATVTDQVIPVGDSLYVALCTDGTSTAPTVADTRGNTWSNDRNITQATGATGVRVTILSCYVATALQIGDTITVTHGSVTARAAIFFQGRGGTETSRVDTNAGNSGTSGTPSVTTPAPTNPVVMAIGVWGTEGPEGDTFALPSGGGWTLIDRIGTSGGNALTNVTVMCAYKKKTDGTSTTWNPTGDSRDYGLICAHYKQALGYRDTIDAAWGVTYPTALPSNASPAQNTSSFTDLEAKFWYSTDDPLCIPSATTTFEGAIGANADVVSLGDVGHSPGALDYDDVADYLLTFSR